MMIIIFNNYYNAFFPFCLQYFVYGRMKRSIVVSLCLRGSHKKWKGAGCKDGAALPMMSEVFKSHNFFSLFLFSDNYVHCSNYYYCRLIIIIVFIIHMNGKKKK